MKESVGRFLFFAAVFAIVQYAWRRPSPEVPHDAELLEAGEELIKCARGADIRFRGPWNAERNVPRLSNPCERGDVYFVTHNNSRVNAGDRMYCLYGDWVPIHTVAHRDTNHLVFGFENKISTQCVSLFVFPE